MAETTGHKNDSGGRINDANEAYQAAIAYDSFQGTTNADTLLWLVARAVQAPVLDVGAGDGSLMLALERRGFSPVEGLDLVPQSPRVKPGSITALPYADGTWQTAFCTEVIEHLEPEQARAGLREIVRILAPGGRLVVTVPFDEDLRKNTLTCPECKCHFHRYGHRQTFTREAFAALLRDAGFEIETLKVYALGAMATLPLGRYFNGILKRLKYGFIANTLVAIARRP